MPLVRRPVQRRVSERLSSVLLCRSILRHYVRAPSSLASALLPSRRGVFTNPLSKPWSRISTASSLSTYCSASRPPGLDRRAARSVLKAADLHPRTLANRTRRPSPIRIPPAGAGPSHGALRLGHERDWLDAPLSPSGALWWAIASADCCTAGSAIGLPYSPPPRRRGGGVGATLLHGRCDDRPLDPPQPPLQMMDLVPPPPPHRRRVSDERSVDDSSEGGAAIGASVADGAARYSARVVVSLVVASASALWLQGAPVEGARRSQRGAPRHQPGWPSRGLRCGGGRPALWLRTPVLAPQARVG